MAVSIVSTDGVGLGNGIELDELTWFEKIISCGRGNPRS